jgi:hypothetical protein
MRLSRRRLIALGLLSVLLFVIAAVFLSRSGVLPEAVALPVLAPGILVNILFSGGNVHYADPSDDLFWSVIAWLFLLGLPAGILLRSES